MITKRRLQVLNKQLKNWKQNVVIVGAVVIDINSTPEQGHKPEAGGSVPGTITSQFGGVGHNIAATLAAIIQQKIQSTQNQFLLQNENENDFSQLVFMTVVGDDDHGEAFLKHWAQQGLDCGGIQKIRNRRTPSVSTIFGNEGEVVASIAEVNLTVDKLFLNSKQNILENADLIVLDGNLSSKTIEFLCGFAQYHHIKIWYEPVSVPKSVRGASNLREMFCASPNIKELQKMANQIKQEKNQLKFEVPVDFEILPDWCTNILEDIIVCLTTGIQYLVVTAGEKGAALCTLNNINYNKNQLKQNQYNSSSKYQFLQICVLPLIKTQIINTSGAGDALVAGCIFGILNNQCMEESLYYGAAMATQAVEISGTVPQQIDTQRILMDCKYLRENRKVYSLELG